MRVNKYMYNKEKKSIKKNKLMIKLGKVVWLTIILALIIMVLLGALVLLPGKQPKNVTQISAQGIQIISPKPNDLVSLPIKIIGVVNGDGWSGFESQVGIVELTQGGTILARGVLKATSDWTTLPATFSADLSELLVDCISNDCIISGNANLVFHNENPSGMPSKNKTYTLPIIIK